MAVRKRRMRSARAGGTYPLGEFKLCGFAMENAPAGAKRVPVQTKAALTSDDPFFHHCMRAFAAQVDAELGTTGQSVHLSSASNFAILVEPDFKATLHIDNFNVELEMLAKRGVKKGEAVFLNDIGDIYRGSVPGLAIRPDHHLILCLRHGWKFLLLFDLTPEQPIDVASIERTIGVGMRRLMFEELYAAMENEHVLSALTAAGWFPFNELVGADFQTLQKAIVSNFNLQAVTSELVGKFDKSRLDQMLDRWWQNPHFEKRRQLLTEGVALFSEGRHISSIKTLMTEIEGILRDRHVPRVQGRQGMQKVLDVAFTEVLAFAGVDSIYFPIQFVDYLEKSVFAPFDPDQPTNVATRNTITHGRAPSDAYTNVRALQTILTLDQISKYLTLPSLPKK